MEKLDHNAGVRELDQHDRQAAEWARDDAHYLGVHRTQEQVDAEAARLREQEQEGRIDTLASAFHEDWRKTRFSDGVYQPRVKQTSDSSWIEVNGTDQVDIANTEYPDLPEDWQAENKAAAEVIVGILDDRGEVNLTDEEQRLEVGSQIHDAWLNRNDWARGGELDKPFVELSPDEQAKDIDQVVIAQRVLPV